MDEPVWCGRTWLACTESWPQPDRTPLGWIRAETPSQASGRMVKNSHKHTPKPCGKLAQKSWSCSSCKGWAVIPFWSVFSDSCIGCASLTSYTLTAQLCKLYHTPDLLHIIHETNWRFWFRFIPTMNSNACSAWSSFAQIFWLSRSLILDSLNRYSVRIKLNTHWQASTSQWTVVLL